MDTAGTFDLDTVCSTFLMTVPLILNLSTWNVRGLSKPEKQELAGTDCDRYNLHIIGLQETKICEADTLYLSNGHKLIFYNQKECRHGGLGFLINKKCIDSVRTSHQISDRVAYIDIILPNNNSDCKPWSARIINCYSPTLPNCLEDPNLADKFYSELDLAVNVPVCHEVFILGDFNAKLGKRSSIDVINRLCDHIGNHGVGRRNSNGERLLNFLISHNLIATNTCFKHPNRHITTRTGYIKDKATKLTRPYYSQIDYILSRSRSRCLLQDSRAYAGTKLESDHKIVVSKLNLGWRYKMSSNIGGKLFKYDTTSLACSNIIKQKYSHDLEEAISVEEDSADVNKDFEKLFECVRAVAKATVGKRQQTQRRSHTNDPHIVSMSNIRYKLRCQMKNNYPSDRTEIRRKVNRLQKDIKKRLKKLKEKHANNIAQNINQSGRLA